MHMDYTDMLVWLCLWTNFEKKFSFCFSISNPLPYRNWINQSAFLKHRSKCGLFCKPLLPKVTQNKLLCVSLVTCNFSLRGKNHCKWYKVILSEHDCETFLFWELFHFLRYAKEDWNCSGGLESHFLFIYLFLFTFICYQYVLPLYWKSIRLC